MSIPSRSTRHAVPAVDVSNAYHRPPGVLLLDVREPDEWADGHAPGARLQSLGRLDAATLPASTTVYVICRSGNRSAHATTALIAAGIDAYNVLGGMNAWMEAGFPVER